ncbi:CD209 antigen-like protein A [Cheilinus undulatus]|uniref:CD209 antigen-like protein A n=1 Tax=Cheilinus undulatus TaxID=241271 RepID=UPI001BD363B2|nr:CD209 antigen-like protein A [Cheilinus undulatus]
MSSNIYEEPKVSMNVRFSGGVQKDGGEREERVVDIYESADTWTDQGGLCPEHPPPVHRNPFKAVALILALLCLLLVIALTVLTHFYDINMTYKSSYEEMKNKYDSLSNSLCLFENSTVVWTRFQLSCYYKSTENKSWDEGRRDCQDRGADLVVINSREEQDFLRELNKGGTSWIGLQSVVKQEWDKTSKWEWKWVNNFLKMLLSWGTGVVTTPSEGSKVFMNQRGRFNHTSSGLRGWICEKPIISGNLSV